eukprot:1048782-Prymnesium_polylepis.2
MGSWCQLLMRHTGGIPLRTTSLVNTNLGRVPNCRLDTNGRLPPGHSSPAARAQVRSWNR